jgi:phenylalanine-4-hydroxylase
MFVVPGDHALRSDYSAKAADWTVPQDAESYGPAEHDRWRRLYRRQAQLLNAYAAPAVLSGLDILGIADSIPDFAIVNQRLEALTGWKLVAVPGLVPNDVFFTHLSKRQFPVSRWIREERELDYLVEPDIFHDVFGHVPMLTDPVFADFIEAYGHRGLEALAQGSLEKLTRVYWYMVEFGLMRTDDGLKAFGAGLLSSAAEIRHSIDSPTPHRIGFDMARVMRTTYRIDAFQRTYFVLDSVDDLFEATRCDLSALSSRIEGAPDLSPAHLARGDIIFSRGRHIA